MRRDPRVYCIGEDSCSPSFGVTKASSTSSAPTASKRAISMPPSSLVVRRGHHGLVPVVDCPSPTLSPADGRGRQPDRHSRYMFGGQMAARSRCACVRIGSPARHHSIPSKRREHPRPQGVSPRLRPRARLLDPILSDPRAPLSTAVSTDGLCVTSGDLVPPGADVKARGRRHRHRQPRAWCPEPRAARRLAGVASNFDVVDPRSLVPLDRAPLQLRGEDAPGVIAERPCAAPPRVAACGDGIFLRRAHSPIAWWRGPTCPSLQSAAGGVPTPGAGTSSPPSGVLK